MFLCRNTKNNVYPCKTQFYYIKVGFKGVNSIYACFRDGLKISASLGVLNIKPSSEKGSTLKGKTLLQRRSNSFVLK